MSVDDERPSRRVSARRVTDLLIASAVVLVSVVPPLERMRVSGFNSDDVAWLVGLHSWRPGDGTLVLVENTNVLHIPLLVLVDLVMPVSSWSLLVGAVVLHAVGFWLIVSFARYAIAEVRGSTVAELPWRSDVTAVAACAAYQLLSPVTRFANAGLTTRNLEAGLYLLVLRWCYEVVIGRRDVVGVRSLAVVGTGTAVLALNDPLVVVTLFVPLVLAVVIASPMRGRIDHEAWRRARRLALAIGGGLVGWQLLRLVLRVADVRQADSPTEIADPTTWGAHIRPVVGGIGRVLGRGLLRDDTALVQLIGAAGLFVAGISVIVVVWSIRPRPWLTIAALGWFAIVTITYFVSTAGASQDSFRYVVVGMPAVAVAVAVAFDTKLRAAEPALWVFAVLAAVLAGTLGLARDDDDSERAAIEAAGAVERVAADGYAYGYSGYWSAPIVTYLSDFAAPVVAVQCRDGFNVPFELLQDLGPFDRAIVDPAPKTFILVDRGEQAWACPDERLVVQHGEPTNVVAAGPTMELWLYDRDVVAEVAQTTTPPRLPTSTDP